MVNIRYRDVEWDLNLILGALEDYVVIRADDAFPEDFLGKDVDILTGDLAACLQNIKNIQFDRRVFKIRVKDVEYNASYGFAEFYVRAPLQGKHYQVEVMRGSRLVVKYDLHQELPYRKFVIKDGYYRKVLCNKVLTRRGSLDFYVPGAEEDPVLRYMEYYEKKNLRPDKIKHLRYIQRQYPQVADPREEVLKEPDISLVNSRYDSFLVRGPGIGYMEGILKELTRHPDFTVLLVKRHEPKSLKNFLNLVYSLDRTPKRHIRNKTKHLLSPPFPSVVFFILFRNRNVEEMTYQKGTAFEVRKCENVEKLKWKLRARYNPRHPDRNYSISDKLPAGITHDHVLHGADGEEETRLIMSRLGLGSPESHDTDPGRKPRVPRDMKEWQTSKIMRVKTDELRVRILGKGRVRIEDSPHFSYVSGEKKEYILYWRKDLGKRMTPNHSPCAFDLLIERFDAEKYNDQQERLIVVMHNLVVYDGAHRVSILKRKGIEIVKVALLSP